MPLPAVLHRLRDAPEDIHGESDEDGETSDSSSAGGGGSLSPSLQVRLMQRRLARDLRHVERATAQRCLQYDQATEEGSTLMLESLAEVRDMCNSPDAAARGVVVGPAAPADTSLALHNADGMVYDDTLCDAEDEGNGVFTTLSHRQHPAAPPPRHDDSIAKEQAATALVTAFRKVTTTTCSAGSSSVHDLPFVVAKKTEVRDVALSPASPHDGELRALRAQATEQERQMRDLLAALQAASAEIKRERRLRTEAEEALHHARRKKRDAAQDSPPKAQRDTHAAMVVALRVENEQLVEDNAQLVGELDHLRSKPEGLLRAERDACRRESAQLRAELAEARSAAERWEALHADAAAHAAELEAELREACSGGVSGEEAALLAESPMDAASAAGSTATSASLDEDTYLRHRMQRALAPPPHPEALGIIVASMVKELKREWRALHGEELRLAKRQGGVYVYRDRKLHLQVVGGKLAFRAGGGHVDLLSHIARQEACRRREPR